MPLNKDIENALDPLLAVFQKDLEFRMNGWMVATYLKGQAEMITWGKTKGGIPIAYEGPPISKAIDWAEKHSATLVTQMAEETKKRLAYTISQGIENKRGIPGLARDIRKTFDDMSKHRSELIARTETANALSQASLDTMEDMGIDGKEWVTVGDDLVSDECLANEAQGAISVSQAFSGGTMAPPQHPDCLLPNNEVLPLGLVAMSRAFYKGKVIELFTRSGNRLTITPNHPILTPLGFVSAEKLDVGDYIICCFDCERMISSINPDYEYTPTTIEKIWEALFLSFGMSSVRVEITPIDFHSDARFFYGDVDVINTNRFLKSDVGDTFGSEHTSKDELSLRSTDTFPLSGQGFSFPFGDSSFPPPDSLVGSGDSSHPLGGRHPSHASNVGLATIARSDASFKQVPTDDISTYAKLSSQFLFRFASLITADEVVKVRYFNYSGHVYNLQSLEQLYIGNTIIVKNCRCSLAPARLRK